MSTIEWSDLEPIFAAQNEFAQRIGCGPQNRLVLHISENSQVTASVSWDPISKAYRTEISFALLEWINQSATAFADAVFSDPLEANDNAGLKAYMKQSWLLAILSHEFAHIGAGHMDYLMARTENPLKAYDELHVRRLGVGPDKVPLRFFEYEADFGGGLWLADFAANPPNSIDRWKTAATQENLIVALAGFALFTFRLEAQVRNGKRLSQNYPAPLLRLNIFISSMLSAWDEQTHDTSFAEAILKPTIEVLWSAREQFPEVDFVRVFADASWMNSIQKQVDELVSETSQYGDFIKSYRLSSFVD